MSGERNNDAGTSGAKPWQFQQGNPGRPRGARNRATLAAMALLEGEAEALTRRCVALALAGDTTAMRLCLERLLPRCRPVRLQLPMRTLAGLDAASETVSEALAEGTIVLDEVATLTGLIDARRRVLETTELERCLVVLEQEKAS